MKKILVFLLVAVVIVSVGFLTGCSGKSKDEAAPSDTAVQDAPAKYSMVFIVKSLDNPFWDGMRQGAERAAADLGIEIDTMAPIKPYNVEEQIRFIEQAITRGVDAICIVPGDSQGIVPAIEKANAAGILVVTPNTKAYGGDVAVWTGAANYEAAYEVTKFALSKMTGTPKIIYLEGTPGNQTATDRMEGAMKAIKEAGAEVLTSQTAKFQRVEGQRVMENLLQQYDDVDMVICGNDEMALGAVEAIAAAGRTDKIKVTGFDGNFDAQKAIYEGKMLCTGDQRSDGQGYWGVLSAYLILEDIQCPSNIALPAPIISSENIEKYKGNF